MNTSADSPAGYRRSAPVPASPRWSLFVLAPAVLSDFRLNLLARYLCFAIVAVGIGLAWGRGGMLILGQGVFFGLGAYAMGLHMKLDDAGPGRRARLHAADARTTCPAGWRRSAAPCVTLLAIVAAARAGGRSCSGWPPSSARSAAPTSPSCPRRWRPRSRPLIIVLGQSGHYTNGTNGLNNFRSFFGYDLNDPVEPEDAVLHRRRRCCWSWWRSTGSCGVSRYGELLRGLPRVGGAGPLPRLRPGEHQDRGVRDRRGDGRYRRGAVRADRRHHHPARTSASCRRSRC